MEHEALFHHRVSDTDPADHGWYFTCDCGFTGHEFSEESSAMQNMEDHKAGLI